MGQECKKKRHSYFDSNNQRFRIGAIAESLGINKAELYSMEYGRINPQPLVEYWAKQEP